MTYSPRIREAAMRRYDEGVPLPVISVELGPSVSAIGAWARASGRPARQASPRVSPVRASAEVKARAVALYESGLSMATVARELGYTPAAIRLWLQAGHVTLRRIVQESPVPVEVRERAVSLYLSGLSSTQVATEVGHSVTAVLKWVHQAGHAARRREPRPRPVPRRTHPPEVQARAVAAYESGGSVRGIGRDLGVSPRMVYAWVDAAEVPRRRAQRVTASVRAEAVARVRAGEDPDWIAGEYGVTGLSVRRWMRDPKVGSWVGG